MVLPLQSVWQQREIRKRFTSSPIPLTVTKKGGLRRFAVMHTAVKCGFFWPGAGVVTGEMPAPPASRGHLCRKYRRETRSVRFCVLGLVSTNRSSGLKMRRTRDLPVRQLKCTHPNGNAYGVSEGEKP